MNHLFFDINDDIPELTGCNKLRLFCELTQVNTDVNQRILLVVRMGKRNLIEKRS